MQFIKGKSRKEYPIFRGLFEYFPYALLEVAHVSLIGNKQHNEPDNLHWNRDKSNDHLDAMLRHTLEAGDIDDDGIRHSAKIAWRALANLQLELEKAEYYATSDKEKQRELLKDIIKADEKDALYDESFNIKE